MIKTCPKCNKVIKPRRARLCSDCTAGFNLNARKLIKRMPVLLRKSKQLKEVQEKYKCLKKKYDRIICILDCLINTLGCSDVTTRNYHLKLGSWKGY